MMRNGGYVSQGRHLHLKEMKKTGRIDKNVPVFITNEEYSWLKNVGKPESALRRED